MLTSLIRSAVVLFVSTIVGCDEAAQTKSVPEECSEDRLVVGYPDLDGDGFGVSEGRITPCDELPDGYADNSLDCDDSEAAVNPAAEEVCDGVDNDCDDLTDEEAADRRTFYRDQDADGYGDAEDPVQACDLPDGYVIWSGDCDELDATVHPGAADVCDEVDNDCNGVVDDGDEDAMVPWYPDTDGDGHGDAEAPIFSCTQPEGTTGSPSDCDDEDPTSHLGAEEVCDGVDNNCNGAIDEDAGCDTGTL